MLPLFDTSIQAGFEAAGELFRLLDNHLPGQQQLYEAWKEKYPLRAIRYEKKIMRKKLQALRELHRFMVTTGISAETLAAYTGGNIRTQKALEEMMAALEQKLLARKKQ